MWKSDFKTIINFAIAKEYEAERLYHELAKQPSLKQYSRFFTEMARDEIIHAQKLERLRFREKDISLPRNMIQSHCVTAIFSQINIDGFKDIHDIFVFFVQEEQKNILLYRELANNIDDCTIKNLFIKLEEEEKKHKKILEERFNEICNTM